VNTNTIGIKLGDGSFYPILEENFKGKKRFVLSTVRDNQESMQIDFFSSKEQDIDNSEYIGSLVIDNISPAKKGAPEIEVVIGLDMDNKLHAVAKNLASSEKQSLSVSLESLPDESAYTVPDFEFDEKMQPHDLFKEDEEIEEEGIPEKAYTVSDEGPKEEKPVKKGNPVIKVLLVVASLVLLAGLYFLVNWLVGRYFNPQNRTNISESNKIVSATAEKYKIAPTEQPKPTAEKSKLSVITEKETANQKEKVVPTAETAATKVNVQESESQKNKNAKPGVSYTVVKGDTLWDLSATFYRDPFQWYRIYRHKPNKIRNPDLIFIGQKIFIPEK
jgi:LysM repeat protein